MEYKYPVAKPSLKGNELKYVMDAVNTGWISSQGDYIRQFEKQFAKWNDTKYGAACSSGTAALTLALRALNLNPEDEVIVPEFTMIASAWAVDYAGAKPVFVDCGEDLNIDVNLLERKITEKTKAIMPVHIYGRRCSMDKIMDLAYNYNLRVIEDSSEAHGVKPVGDIACFSLFANKIISSGEGGICLTNDERLDKQIKHLRAMAFTPQHDFLHPKRAYNFRMTNLQGAIALAQTERLDEILERRKQIEENYNRYLKEIPEVTLMPNRDVLWMYDLLVKNRGKLEEHLKNEGIETRKFFRPMSQQPMYFNENWKTLNAVKFSDSGLYLPTYLELTPTDQKDIAEEIKKFYKKN